MRALPANKHPIILGNELGLELDIYKSLGIKKLNERAQKIYENKQFSEKVSFALGEIAREKNKYKEKKLLAFEDQLFSGGFPDNEDQLLLEEFQHLDDWKLKNEIS